MKCKELQILDWITDGHGLPMQITNVGDDYAALSEALKDWDREIKKIRDKTEELIMMK